MKNKILYDNSNTKSRQWLLVYSLLSILTVLFCLCSCAVPQWQREYLSDPIMRFDEGTNASEMDSRILPLREGAAGAEGAGSGGCGC